MRQTTTIDVYRLPRRTNLTEYIKHLGIHYNDPERRFVVIQSCVTETFDSQCLRHSLEGCLIQKITIAARFLGIILS